LKKNHRFIKKKKKTVLLSYMFNPRKKGAMFKTKGKVLKYRNYESRSTS